MKHFQISVEINAPADRVWAIMRDVERWPEWTATVSKVEPLDSGPLAPGRRFRIRQPKLLPATWTVTELDEGRGFTWETGSPLVRVRGSHSVQREGRTSRVVLELEFAGPLGSVVAHLTRSLNQRYLSIEAEGLKRRSESNQLVRSY